MKNQLLIIIVILVIILSSLDINAQSLTWLGTLGGAVSTAYSVSDDGSVVVGESDNLLENSRAFIWTAANGIQPLNTLQNINSWASHITPDGNIVVGSANVGAFNYQAMKWTSNGGVEFLGTLGGSGSTNNSEGTFCLPDGSIVVGAAATASNNHHAFKWTSSNGMEDLGTFNNVNNYVSKANSISDDGSLIVGYSEYNSGYYRPCYWLNSTINELLTSMATSIELGEARSTSGNGNNICGWIDDSTTFSDEHAYLWRGNPSFGGVDIGLLPGVALGQGTSVAFDVNDNREVVGTATDTLYEDNAFYWYEGVIQNLNLTYPGIIPFGSKLITANAISNNGRYIVGQGFNGTTFRREAFLLDRGGPTSVENTGSLLKNYSLEQNYPNPFNPSTMISWQSPVGSHQTLKIYDVLGNEVATLVDEYKEAGKYEVSFDASRLSSGIYFYKLQAGLYTQIKKMILMR